MNTMQESATINKVAEIYKLEVLKDYRTCCLSREASLIARKDVLTGKAKFGIVGDGKEVPQVALARAFKKGDFRAGYYRDQTWMFALGLTTVEEFFAQLYADSENDPFSKGRQMNCHFATKIIDEHGNFTEHKNMYNVTSDISSTAGQMARGVGLALASKKYRECESLQGENIFSNHGNEVCFCTIGDASTSEGAFWEAVNAAGVLQIPLAISVWDDGYGISVPTKFQTTKESISEALAGFQTNEQGQGIDIYTVHGWDYPALCELYETTIASMRETHRPALIHVLELTQPQGHSTSGSHERYKTKERLDWEKEHDCILVMRQWILDNDIAGEDDLSDIEQEAKQYVRDARNRAWQQYIQPVKNELQHITGIFEAAVEENPALQEILTDLQSTVEPLFKDIVKTVRRALFVLNPNVPTAQTLSAWYAQAQQTTKVRYHEHLHSETPKAVLNIPPSYPTYSENAPLKNGFEIINTYFDSIFAKYPNVLAFGEDVGQIGDVNQGFAGLQEKYGSARVFDTGIREWTIMGQAIGLAMRGIRPIAEIQYLDYLLYGLAPLSDDLASLRYRSAGLQTAPAIIRTRGHRLEGIWHSGSPMGMILHSLRGMCVVCPRDFTQAAGFYNTLLQSDEPALVIECLNGYRLKEKMPENLSEYCLPLGVPEILQQGNDITLVTYGSCVRIAKEGILLLEKCGISVELIDVQTLLPFDINSLISQSLQKTNRLLVLDEDVPGGASAFILQQILDAQNGYQYLDAKPLTLTAKAHRPPYGSDGDYFSKPNAEDVFAYIYNMMYEANPIQFPQKAFINAN